jgi:flagellar hook-associated protein 3 FlgL
MAVRISQRQIYSSSVSGMNKNLSELMKLHEQNTTQKKVNRPADDPYGSAQILAANNTLAAIKQYQDNLDTAKGWLDQTDGVLSLVDTALVELTTILEQGATGTLSKEQRQNLAFKARAILDQLIAYSNTTFSGRSIFAGHKTDGNAFERALAVTCNDPNVSDVQYKVSGGSESTVIVQFTQNGNLDDTPPPAFRYSADAGETWQTGSWDPSGKIMQAGSVHVEPVFDPAATNKTVSAVNTANPHEAENGTWMYIRPTAVYIGDTNDANVAQTYPLGSTVHGSVEGVFSRDVVVRVDNIAGGRIAYSYSLDNGDSWTSSSAPFVPGASELAVPGGILTLDAFTPAGINSGDEYVIKPYRADIELNVGSNSSIVINNVGKDVFGGIYAAPFSGNGPQAVNGYGKNVFEVCGEAIAYFESNSQQGCQEILEELGRAMEYVVGYRTKTGARMNRVEAIENQLEFLRYDEEGRLSTLEDVDVSELLSKLSQQQIAYTSVLKSSSMIMQMSLLNFI